MYKWKTSATDNINMTWVLLLQAALLLLTLQRPQEMGGWWASAGRMCVFRVTVELACKSRIHLTSATLTTSSTLPYTLLTALSPSVSKHCYSQYPRTHRRTGRRTDGQTDRIALNPDLWRLNDHYIPTSSWIEVKCMLYSSHCCCSVISTTKACHINSNDTCKCSTHWFR